MTTAIQRLHRRRGNKSGDGASQQVLLPPWARWLATRAELTRDQALGIHIWIAGSPVVIAIGWLVLGRGAAIVAAAIVASAPVGLLFVWSGRRRDRFVASLPALVDTVSRSLRSGASFRQALAEASIDAPPLLRPQLCGVLDAIDRGQPTWQALQLWATRRPEPEVRIVAAGLAVASENEAGASRALDGVGQSLRDRAALAGEIRAQTAQAAASMQALAFLPLGFLAIDALGEQRTVRYLIHQRLGNLCLIAGVALAACGWIWMTMVVRRLLPT